MFTTVGIIGGVVLAVIIGGFFGMIIWSSRMPFIKKVMVQCLLCGFVFLFCAFGFSAEEKNWNDGYCVNCGTKYECVGKSKTTNEYYYSCPNCFHKANY